MSRPPYMHSNFFSSLKQVEKRLKLDYSSSLGNPSSPIPGPRLPVQLSSLLPEEEGNVESLVSSALYLHTTNDQTRSCTAKGSEKPAVEFLSMSNEFSSAPNELPPQHSHINQSEEVDLLDGNNQNVIDDVQLLLTMLHLSTFEVDEEGQGKGTKDVGEEGWCCLSKGEKQNDDIVDLENGASDGECCDKLSGKFVRVKGPICQKEARRLEGWIKHFLNGGKDVLEPFRLAHLLLGKAALAVGDEEDGLDELLVFPSTIDEYLHNDPPTTSRIHV